MEVQSLCYLAGDLDMIAAAEVEKLILHCDAVARMLNALIEANRLLLKKCVADRA